MRRGAARNPNSSAVYSTYSPSRSPVQMQLETSSSLTGRMAECVSQVCSHHPPILHEVGVLRRPALLLCHFDEPAIVGRESSGRLQHVHDPWQNQSLWHFGTGVPPTPQHVKYMTRPLTRPRAASCSLCPCRSVRTASACP